MNHELTVSEFLNAFFEEKNQTKLGTVFKQKYCKSSFAVLKIYTSNEELKYTYKKAIELHNNNMFTSPYPDSGFDLFAPKQINIDIPYKKQMLDYEIKTEMLYFDKVTDSIVNTAYYMYPRSSFSSTPLILGNHVGIIDSGYRGNLKAAFKFFPDDNDNMESQSYITNYTIDKNQRLMQVCHPSLCPIFVVLMDVDNFESTERGSGGFGSTGI